MSSPSQWEQRFPTFVGGSTSAAVARPSVRSTAAASAARRHAAPPRAHPWRPSSVIERHRTLSRVSEPAEEQPDTPPPFSTPPADTTPPLWSRVLSRGKDTDERMPEDPALDFGGRGIVPGQPASAAATRPGTGFVSSSLLSTLSDRDVGARGGVNPPRLVPVGTQGFRPRGADASSSPEQRVPSRSGSPNARGVRVAHLETETSVVGAPNGYDEVLGAIDRLQARLSHLPLHDRWGVMSKWLDRYALDHTADTMANSAAAVYHELTTKKKAAMTPKGQEEVNGKRTAMSFMLLEQILYIIGHAYPQMLPLSQAVRDDVMNAVYVAPDTPVDLTSSFFVMDDPTDVEQQQRLVERFYKKTYYQCLRETASKLNQRVLVFESSERVKDKQMRILNRIVAYWQRYTKRLMFHGWRGYVAGRHRKHQMQRHARLVQNQLEATTASLTETTQKQDRSIEALRSENDSLANELRSAKEMLTKLQEEKAALLQTASEARSSYDRDAGVKRLTEENERLRRELFLYRRANLEGSSAPLAYSGMLSTSTRDPAASHHTNRRESATTANSTRRGSAEEPDEELEALRRRLAEANGRVEQLEKSLASVPV